MFIGNGIHHLYQNRQIHVMKFKTFRKLKNIILNIIFTIMTFSKSIVNFQEKV